MMSQPSTRLTALPLACEHNLQQALRLLVEALRLHPTQTDATFWAGHASVLFAHGVLAAYQSSPVALSAVARQVASALALLGESGTVAQPIAALSMLTVV